MVFKDYYKILELTTPKVTQEEIKIAYRNMAKKYHPDINAGHDEIIKDITEAYKTLSDLEKKKKYDKLWISYVGRAKNSNVTYKQGKKVLSIMDELSSIFFGTVLEEKKEKVKEDNNEYINLNITMEEAYLGTTKVLVRNSKEIEVVIPSRTLNNTNITLKGKGKKIGKTKLKSNLVVTVSYNENESNYKKEGLNLVKKIELNPSDLVLGTKLEEDIYGEKISLIISKNTPNGKKFVLKNRGFKSKTEQKGDVILKIVAKIPEEVTKTEEELYQKLNEIEKEKN